MISILDTQPLIRTGQHLSQLLSLFYSFWSKSMETLVSPLLVSAGSVHSLHRYFLDTYYVPGTLLGTGVQQMRNH